MSENIINLPEKIEINIGAALEARNTALSSFVGLGPPDLVVLLKHYTPPKLLLTKPCNYSFYHWALGVDISSSAAVAAYFGSLLDAQEKGSFGRGHYKIEKCTYSSYNAFKKSDLRVEITVPEKEAAGYSIEAYAIDASGNRTEIDDTFWEEVSICAVLRAVSDPPRTLRPLRIKEVLTDIVSETRFLALCAEHFLDGRKMGTSDTGHTLTNVDCSNNLLTSSLRRYFAKLNRFDRSVSFFEPFIDEDPVCAVMVASGDSLLDKPVRATALLKDALSKAPESPSIMLALSEIMLRHLQSDHKKDLTLLDVLRLTLKSVARQSSYPRGWFTLAHTLIEMGRCDWALVVMNYAPSLPYDSSIDQMGIPPFAKITTPLVAHPNVVTLLQDEEYDFLSLPSEDSLRLLSAPALSKDGKAAYDLLAEMVAREGWEQLTILRTRVLERPAQLLRRSKQMVLDSLASSGSYTSKDDKESGAPQSASEYSFVPTSVAEEGEIKKEFPEDTNSSSVPEHLLSPQRLKQMDILPSATFIPLEPSDDTACVFEAEDDTYKPETIVKEAQKEAETTQQASKQTEQLRGSDGALIMPDIQDVTIVHEPDVDDALTKFLIRATALRCNIAEEDVQTTPMNVEKASSPLIPILGISRTVDLAFHALFQDVKAFHGWKEEQKKKGFNNETITPKVAPSRTTADWIHLAMLCERLNFREDAEAIYRMVAPLHIKALTSLVKLESEAGDIRDTLLTASQLLTHYEERFHVQQVHPEVVAALLRLISQHGLQKVRAVQVPNTHPQIANILLDANRWGSRGCDL